MTTTTLGSELFPYEGKRNGHLCICGEASCARLTACFSSLNDARGAKLVLPALGGSRNAAIKRHKLERTCHHLGLGTDNIEQYASIDNRNRSLRDPTPTEKYKGGSKKARTEAVARQSRCVAVHHFHPKVVELCLEGGKLNYPDYLTESFVKESGLWQNGYTEADYFGEYKQKGTGVVRAFAPVPSYKFADDDYRTIATRYRIDDLVLRCTAAVYGGADRDEEDEEEPRPIDGMTRLASDGVRDLQRAVCLLADDVDRLRLERDDLRRRLDDMEMTGQREPE